jgi:hypothetical protein
MHEKSSGAVAIHSAMLAGARAFGNSLQVAFDRWHDWASKQRDFIVGDRPSITEDEYARVSERFAALGIRSPSPLTCATAPESDQATPKAVQESETLSL